jgi:hypothetical protein
VPSVPFQHVSLHNNAMESGRVSGQVVCRVGQRSLQRGLWTGYQSCAGA